MGVGLVDPIHPKPDKWSCTRQTTVVSWTQTLSHQSLITTGKWAKTLHKAVFFFLFLSYCICCFSTTTLILKCFSWYCASHGRNKLVESNHTPITVTGLCYTHWNVWFIGMSYCSSYHQAAKSIVICMCQDNSRFVCIKILFGRDWDLRRKDSLPKGEFFSCGMKNKKNQLI